MHAGKGHTILQFVNFLPVKETAYLMTELFPTQLSTLLKEFADDTSEFHENDRKFSKTVENNVGKGEIAHYVSFFKRLVLQTCKNNGLFRKGLHSFKTN